MPEPVNDLNALHILWTTAITIAGAIVAFFTKRLVDEVDSKADKTEITAVRRDLEDKADASEISSLKEDVKALFARQDAHHASSVQRLDQVLMLLSSGQQNSNRNNQR